MRKDSPALTFLATFATNYVTILGLAIFVALFNGVPLRQMMLPLAYYLAISAAAAGGAIIATFRDNRKNPGWLAVAGVAAGAGCIMLVYQAARCGVIPKSEVQDSALILVAILVAISTIIYFAFKSGASEQS